MLRKDIKFQNLSEDTTDIAIIFCKQLNAVTVLTLYISDIRLPTKLLLGKHTVLDRDNFLGLHGTVRTPSKICDFSIELSC